MIRTARSHFLIFLAGLAAVVAGAVLAPPAVATPLSVTGIALCVFALWRAHSTSDEVARQFALTAFAAGFAAMAGWSLWFEGGVSPAPVWAVGFGSFLLVYALQWVRAQW